MVSAIVTLTTAVAAGWLIWLSRDPESRIAAARAVGAAALVAIAFWLGLVVLYAPIEQVQGIVQKIFYVHIPAIIPMYLGFVLTAVGGIGYLRTRDDRWDHLAISGAEVGVIFCSLMLVVGPIWAKPAWGQWWVWDMRLTSTLVLWFIYVAYLFLRGLAFGSDPAKTFTSIYGIVGTAAILFVYFAIDLAQGSTMHPSNPAREGLPPAMGQTVGAGMVAFVLVFAWLVARRLEVAALEAHELLHRPRGAV
jgi:heme exporter protein C